MRRAAQLALLAALTLMAISSCRLAAEAARDDEREPERWRAHVVSSSPHDASSYTQGLLWHGGTLYESHGRYGMSGLRKTRFEDGAVIGEVALAPDLFGEGLALIAGDVLVQLTWRAGVAIYYDQEDLREVGRRGYEGEGWGLAWDGEHLIMSDGSHVLTYRDPETFEVTRKLPVLQRGSPRDSLNELEFVNGALYANVYETDEIVRIDPDSGAVTAVIDASGLLSSAEASNAEVLNGIAYVPETDRFLVTGKYWPRLFEVTFEPVAEPEDEKR